MKPIDDRDHPRWMSEGWTGEQDHVAAYALGACLAIAFLIFLFLGMTELRP